MPFPETKILHPREPTATECLIGDRWCTDPAPSTDHDAAAVETYSRNLDDYIINTEIGKDTELQPHRLLWRTVTGVITSRARVLH